MKYDVIVVGGGLGGLTAGAKLAKSGKSVLLIEQHDRVGGCATTFKRKDFTMEVGLHEMDGLHRGDMKTRIFSDLGILDELEFLKVPEFYRFVNGRYDVVVGHNPDEMIERLTKIFPSEKKGIQAYYELIVNIRQVIKTGQIDHNDTIGDFLDRSIKDEDLKLILLGNLGYFHDDPYSLSLIYYCMAQNSYYTGGGNFIKGGSQQLSNALARIIEENGGRVVLNHQVTRIHYRGDLVKSVVYQGKGVGEAITDQADQFVLNASIPQFGEKLLKGSKAQVVRDSYFGYTPGASLLTVYFGFKQSPYRMGHRHYSTFVYDESVKDQRGILPNNRSNFDTRSFTFVDYSQINSDLSVSGKGVGAICCIDYLDDWASLSREEYKTKKKQVEITFVRRLDALIPGVAEQIEYVEVGTSKTVQRYTLNPKGSVYGFAQTPERSGKAITSPFTNLHYASAWTQTGGGFSGAIFSGYLGAMDVIRKTR